MAELRIYLDLLFQPCQPVYIFAQVNKIPFKFEKIQLLKGDHLSEEFLKVNALSQVPALDDGSFTLSESSAIMLYMARKYNTPDHWYPSDLQKCARVDEYLAWQHTNLHPKCFEVFSAKYLTKVVLGHDVSSGKLDPIMVELSSVITDLEKVFLQDKMFLASDEISLADIMAISDIMQVVACGLDLFDDRPKLAAWKQRVVAAIGEQLFNEAHEQILEVKELEGETPPHVREGLKARLALYLS